MSDRASNSEERHERVSDLFLQACELAPEAREAFLVAAAEGDEELLSELRELLSHDPGNLTSDGARLKPEFAQAAVETSLCGDLPKRLGGYDVIERLGEGGMGIVYRARQHSPERDVALKVVPAGFAHPDALRRFELEAELLGRLRHPGIAQIFEAGVDRSGPREQPFLAMELIEGKTLSYWARSERPGTSQSFELLAEIADAVAHAHQNGVVHRDLKPSNILIDEEGRARVLDFGVARALDESPAATALTRTGQLVGTLPYMSPEQVSGDPLAVDTRTDVYSLGVLSYELLTGKLPLEVMDTPLVDAARRISEEEPVSLGQVDKRLRGDVDTVVSMAMAKDKERRYASASAFAEDLRRVLAHEVIAARPPSTFVECAVEIQDIEQRLGRVLGVPTGKSHALGLIAALLRVLAAGVIHENAPHGLRSDRAKVSVIFHARLFLISDAHSGFVNQRGGLQRVIDALATQESGRDAA